MGPLLLREGTKNAKYIWLLGGWICFSTSFNLRQLPPKASLLESLQGKKGQIGESPKEQ